MKAAKPKPQLADRESWKTCPVMAADAFMRYCEQRKMWPGDHSDAWEHFYAGWIAGEQHT